MRTTPRKHAREFGLTLPVLIDAKHELVSAAGITRTPEVAVFTPDGTLAYRGRIDDRYAGFGKKRPVPTQRDLRDALTAIAAGEDGTDDTHRSRRLLRARPAVNESV